MTSAWLMTNCRQPTGNLQGISMTDTSIDEGMLKFYAELKAKSPPESVNWPLPAQRRAWDDVCRAFRAPRPAGLDVEDRLIDGVHVRIFRPATSRPCPGIIYFHGG